MNVHAISAQIQNSKTGDPYYPYHKRIHKEIMGKSVEEVYKLLLLKPEHYQKATVDPNGCRGVSVKLTDGTELRLFVKKLECSSYECIKNEIVVGYVWRLGFRNLKHRGVTYWKCSILEKRRMIKNGRRARTSAEIPGHL